MTVRVYFEPIVPDNVSSLYEILMEVAKDFGLADCWEPWTCRDRLVMNIPTDANSWEFCKRMRRSCMVGIFQSE